MHKHHKHMKAGLTRKRMEKIDQIAPFISNSHTVLRCIFV